MSSSWRPEASQNALLTRQSRSSAMAGDRPDTPHRPGVRPGVPLWLVSQQQQMLRSAGAQPPAPPAQAPGKKPPEKTRDDPEPPPDDDFVMVDLLDGAHLPTRPSPLQNRMSANSDSIISLPPIDDNAAPPRWQKLKAEAQEARSRGRSGASVGGMPPNYIRSARKTPVPVRSPIQPPLSREEVIVPIAEDLSMEAEPSSLIHSAPSLRADSIGKGPARRERAPIPPPPAYRSENKTPEIMPLLPHEATFRKTHSRRDSYSLRDWYSCMDDDHTSGTNSSRSNPSLTPGRRRGRHRDDDFQPGIWGWRMPAEEDAIMPSGAWIYLALIGFLTFLIAYSVNASSDFISNQCISRLAEWVEQLYGKRASLGTLAGMRGLALAASFWVILAIAPQYATGSGIPEMKCVLSGVMMPRMLNWKTLVAKMLGLVLSLSSGISIGRLGPFIHMSGITAALVTKIPWFTSLRASARFQLQALSAAMAAGVGATFGAPIGGTMLSIEIMSTYYYIHWLPMALYCSIMGYYCVVSLVRSDAHAFFSSNVTVELEVESIRRLFTYIILGIVCGFVGAALVQLTKAAFIVRRRYFKNSTPLRTTVMVTMFAIGHTLVVLWVGGVLSLGQKDGVIELINSTHDDEMWLTDSWKPFTYAHWNSCISLLFASAVKFILTGISLVMPVPAGTFMPIFEIGALVGRAFGELCSGFSFVHWVDARATAIIGAAAVTSGTLHTTSIAVVMLELTREAIDVLPLAVGVIVSYAVSKHLCSDLFSEFIKIRRLPFILGLRERYPSENKRFLEDVSSVVAGTFMWKNFPFVTPQTTKGEVYRMLTRGGKPWISCAFLSDKEGRRLWGTISQETLWDVIGDDMSVLSSGSNDESFYGTFSQDGTRVSVDDKTIPFLVDFDPSVGHPLVDMGPMQVSSQTPFWKVITFFRMLSMSQMYVMEDGLTVGCVTRAQVIHYSHSVEEKAKRKRDYEQAAELRRKKEEKELLDHFRRNPPSANRLASRPSAKDLAGMTRSRQRSRQGSMHRSRR